MRTTLNRRDRVGERNLLRLTFREGESNFPTTILAGFVDYGWLGRCSSSRCRGGRFSRCEEIHLYVLRRGTSCQSRTLAGATPATNLLETLHLDPLIVQKHLNILDRTGHIINPLHQQRFRIVVDLRHAESSQVRAKCDSGVLFAFLVIGDLREGV